MKEVKCFFAAALVLVLLLATAPGACADVLYPAPAPVQAGSELNHLVATVSADAAISVMEESIPAGVILSAEPGLEGIDIYLRGVPLYAGSYNCIFSAGETSLSCPLTVEPAYPFFLSTSSDVFCSMNDPVQLEVSAYAQDNGTLSYQWYLGQIGSGALIGSNSPTLSVGTSTPGTSYYYCVVTNCNNGYTASASSPVVAVTVENTRSISWISVYTEPYKTSYAPGEPLDTAGLQLSVSYTDGSSELISSGFYVDAVQLTDPGQQAVNVYYEGFSCVFYVTVGEQAEVVTGIGVLTLPVKTRYTVGEALDTTGLSIRAYTNSGIGYRDVGREFLTCSPSVLNTTGEQEILVVYGDKSCTFTVTVQEAEYPASLMVETMPNRVTYTVGQSLDITGLVLKQISSWQNAQLIYSGFTCTPIQLNTVGRQQVTVYYGNLSTSFTVTVTESAPVVTLAPTVQPAAVPTAAPTSVPTAIPSGGQTALPTDGQSASPSYEQTAIPSSAPTAVPTASPAAVPTTAPTVMPTASPSSGTTRTGTRTGHQSSLGRSLIGVIVITALLALVVLGIYVFVMNQGGMEGAEARLRELFGKDKKSGGKNRGRKR